MSTRLAHPQLDHINIESIDDAIGSMIENDNKIIPAYGVTPKIWKCKWYNGSKRNLYKQGQAVWINTEDLDEFTTAHKSEIIDTINNNSTLRNIYKKLNGDETQIYNLCKDVVTGKITGNSEGLPLYFIGDLSKKTQIRISLSDDNDRLPTDNAYWKDFFVNNDPSKFQQQVMDRTSQLCKQYLEQHLLDYHLSGVYDFWLSSEGIPCDIDDFYLKTDMSNIQNPAEYHNDPGSKTKGIDYVLYFTDRKFNDVCWKWFRVWRSGLLEHGGIVDANNADQTGDSLSLPDGNGNPTHFTVNLNWQSASGTAPTYQYGRDAGGFYFDGNAIDVGDGHKIQIDGINKQISQANHYVVSITPITNDVVPYQSMNPIDGTSQSYYYMTKDDDCMTNSSFRFLINSEASLYSYYVRGFVRNIQQGYM